MGDYRLYNGLIVPNRDADKIVRLRVLQSDRAIKALPLFVERRRVCIKEGGIYPTLTIDALGLPVCDLIYLDVEGCEFDALWGAWATILRCKPIIVFEVTRKLDSENATESYMTKYGYHKLGSIGRDWVMGPEAPQGDFCIKNYEFDARGEMVEVGAC